MSSQVEVRLDSVEVLALATFAVRCVQLFVSKWHSVQLQTFFGVSCLVKIKV